MNINLKQNVTHTTYQFLIDSWSLFLQTPKMRVTRALNNKVAEFRIYMNQNRSHEPSKSFVSLLRYAINVINLKKHTSHNLEL